MIKVFTYISLTKEKLNNIYNDLLEKTIKNDKSFDKSKKFPENFKSWKSHDKQIFGENLSMLKRIIHK